jgi:hypothetical protein
VVPEVIFPINTSHVKMLNFFYSHTLSKGGGGGGGGGGDFMKLNPALQQVPTSLVPKREPLKN